jgi:hypothetical protein
MHHDNNCKHKSRVNLDWHYGYAHGQIKLRFDIPSWCVTTVLQTRPSGTNLVARILQYLLPELQSTASFTTWYFLLLFRSSTLLVDLVFLIVEAWWSHSVGLLWTSDQLVSETSTWKHTTLTRDIHASGGIRTRNPSKRTAADSRLRQHGCRYRHLIDLCSMWIHHFVSRVTVTSQSN